MPEALWGRHTRWLTVITVDPTQFGAHREAIRLALEAQNICIGQSDGGIETCPTTSVTYGCYADFVGHACSVTVIGRSTIILTNTEAQNIEARPRPAGTRKPMHLQPVFRGCETVGGGVAEDLFARCLCLPSGSNAFTSTGSVQATGSVQV